MKDLAKRMRRLEEYIQFFEERVAKGVSPRLCNEMLTQLYIRKSRLVMRYGYPAGPERGRGGRRYEKWH